MSVQLLWISGFHLEQKTTSKATWLSSVLAFAIRCLITSFAILEHLHLLLCCVLQMVVYPFVFFLLTIVLSVFLLFTDSDYTFGVFKLFLTCPFLSRDISTCHSILLLLCFLYLPNLSFPDLINPILCLFTFPAFLVLFYVNFPINFVILTHVIC